MKKAMTNKKFWLLVWGLGLAGQLCWNIENQWFTTFVYAKIAKDSTIVTWMVISSALVTAISTFLFGTLSDRMGSRKKLVSTGYIVWGVATILFGLTEFVAGGTVGNGAKVSLWVAILVILADDIMSFFGSMGNDSGFNGWINDHMTDSNRGQLGAALAIQPVVGTIVGTVLGGMLIGSEDNYQRLFWSMGIFVILMGIFGLFMKDSPNLKPNKQGNFWQQFSSVFRFKNLFAQKELLLACGVTIFFFIPFNIYFVHMGNWMLYYLGFTPDTMGLVQGIGLLLATLTTLPAVGLINKNKTPLVAFIAVIVNAVGLWVLYFMARPGGVDAQNILSATNIPLFVGVFFAGAGYILIVQSMTMWLKQLYPEESRGQFEGIRVMAFTLIPMIIGTLMGNAIIKGGAGTRLNDLGQIENIPTESIFLYAAIILMLTFVPLFFAGRMYNQRVANDQKGIKP